MEVYEQSYYPEFDHFLMLQTFTNDLSNSWSNDHCSVNENNSPDSDFLSQEDLNIFNEVYDPLRDRFFASSSQIPDQFTSLTCSPLKVCDSSSSLDNRFPCPSHNCFVEDEEGFFIGLEDHEGARKPEGFEELAGQVLGFNVGPAGPRLGRKGRTKSSGSGQPSKNLMAERRRRKRLNDRLSMLRSIVPKISKMDRTSILGDTIDYMKELLQKIEFLQHQLGPGGPNNLSIMDIVKDMKPNEMLVRNAPKFNVERRNDDRATSIEMCCTMKPGLLLSTVNTIESQDLEIEQCVISCFSDFAMQASCSNNNQQGLGQVEVASPGEIKQALFRNAGYGGRCL